MDLKEYLFVKLMEECNEISMASSKLLVFGENSRNPFEQNSLTNQEKLTLELNDLLGITQLLVEEGLLDENWQNEDLVKAKKDKVKKLMEYSIKEGCLEL